MFCSSSARHTKNHMEDFQVFCSKSQLLAVVMIRKRMHVHSHHTHCIDRLHRWDFSSCLSRLHVCVSLHNFRNDSTWAAELLLTSFNCVGLLKVSAHHLQLLLPASSIASQTNDDVYEPAIYLINIHLIHHRLQVTMLKLDYARINWRAISWTKGETLGDDVTWPAQYCMRMWCQSHHK